MISDRTSKIGGEWRESRAERGLAELVRSRHPTSTPIHPTVPISHISPIGPMTRSAAPGAAALRSRST